MSQDKEGREEDNFFSFFVIKKFLLKAYYDIIESGGIIYGTNT